MLIDYRKIAAAIVVLSSGWATLAVAADLPDLPTKAAKPIIDVPFFRVNDNRLSYSYMPNGTDPGVPGTTAKQVYSFTHFDVWAYGTNFINLNALKSDHNDPAAPCPVGGAKGCEGATEFFGQVRSTFGFNEVFNTSAFKWGPLRNVSLEIGADIETENNYVAPARRVGLVGLQFAFTLPYGGFFNVVPMYYKEVNHNAFLGNAGLPGGHLDFDGTWTVEANYYMDLGFLPEYLPLSISGRAAWIGPKGTGTDLLIPGNLTRKTEFNSEPIRLTLDASKMAWGPTRSHMVDVWVAYRYWQNKYGLDHELSASCTGVNSGSCTESTVYTGVTVKF
ncbi:MAG: hypothetical protein JWP25_3331 [Bradyrhizobium sp.]|jgi:hypothetical protein|nr:hypothetical protein [Bradyrhizobium sp.]